MSRKQLVMIVLLIAIVGAAISALLAQGQGQVTICHRPPDNPSNAQTITVGKGAVNAHLAHGDTLGACPASPGEVI